MSAGGLIARASRAVAFARHMPLDKLIRRVELDLRRRVRDRLPARGIASGTPIPRSSTPPLPLFAPRHHLTPARGPDGLRFTFVGRTIAMTGNHIDWRAPGPGSAHQLWRMNLHYMEYLEGAEASLLPALVEDWLAAAGGNGPGAWRDSWNSYALSLRVVVWMQQLAVRGEALPAELVARMTTSLATQLRFLDANLETDLGGNHLVKNVKALIWASAFFAGPEAQHWRATGLELLSSEIDKQILPDGMHDERSASYHAQVFADLLECRHALGEDPLGGRLDRALSATAQVLADMTHPDGGPALFNDAGLTMAYSPDECLAVFQRLLGPRPLPRGVFALPTAGYFGARTARSYLVADCGRIAPDDLPAHGHGDVLSFEWSVDGRRVIVDQGVYEYVAGEHRQRARAAASHNTLCIEGADQADFFGAFRCGRRPGVEVIAWQPQADGFLLEGTHDGFDALPGKPRHVRRFDICGDRVLIEDRVEGAPVAAARIAFLLHPGIEPEVDGSKATLRNGDTVIAMTSSEPIALEPAVWWPDMGAELPTQRLVLRLAPGRSSAITELRIVTASTTEAARP